MTAGPSESNPSLSQLESHAFERKEDLHGADSAVSKEHGSHELSALPSDLKSSDSARSGEAQSDTRPTKANEVAKYISLAAVVWVSFVMGWNDGTAGPLLPTLQRYYKIGYVVVSLIFILNTIGSLIGAVANIYLYPRLGYGKTIVLGALSQTVAYAIQSPRSPYPAFAIAYCFSGFGMALLNALAILLGMSFSPDGGLTLGILSASYGVGALLAPLSSTHFAAQTHWSFHFLISLSFSLFNLISLIVVFRFQNLDEIMARAGRPAREKATSDESHYRQILSMKVVHLLSFFILAYVGTEVTLGGWIVTFVMDRRGGGPSSGYLATGFFLGLTVGRVALIWVTKLVGMRRVIWLYISICIALELTIWLVPSFVGNAIAVAFIGLFMGPIYPLIMNSSGKLVPEWLQSGAIGWISSFGQIGSAILPFITGALASRFGIMSLQPLIVIVFVLMMGLWAMVPRDSRRNR